MSMLNAIIEGQCWLPRGSLWPPWTTYVCSEAALGSPWGCIRLLRGSIWLPMRSIWLPRGCTWEPLGHCMAVKSQEGPYGCPWGTIWQPMGLHVAAQRLHLGAERQHFAAQEPSVAPMRQICSICCVWLGQAGQPGSWEYAHFRVVG